MKTLRRAGFGTIEPFIVSPVILLFGVTITIAMRWLTGSTHWLTWLPTIMMSIPFGIIYGIAVMKISRNIRG